MFGFGLSDQPFGQIQWLLPVAGNKLPHLAQGHSARDRVRGVRTMGEIAGCLHESAVGAELVVPNPQEPPDQAVHALGLTRPPIPQVEAAGGDHVRLVQRRHRPT